MVIAGLWLVTSCAVCVLVFCVVAPICVCSVMLCLSINFPVSLSVIFWRLFPSVVPPVCVCHLCRRILHICRSSWCPWDATYCQKLQRVWSKNLLKCQYISLNGYFFIVFWLWCDNERVGYPVSLKFEGMWQLRRESYRLNWTRH